MVFFLVVPLQHRSFNVNPKFNVIYFLIIESEEDINLFSIVIIYVQCQAQAANRVSFIHLKFPEISAKTETSTTKPK